MRIFTARAGLVVDPEDPNEASLSEFREALYGIDDSFDGVFDLYAFLTDLRHP